MNNSLTDLTVKGFLDVTAGKDRKKVSVYEIAQ